MGVRIDPPGHDQVVGGIDNSRVTSGYEIRPDLGHALTTNANVGRPAAVGIDHMPTTNQDLRFRRRSRLSLAPGVRFKARRQRRLGRAAEARHPGNGGRGATDGITAIHSMLLQRGENL